MEVKCCLAELFQSIMIKPFTIVNLIEGVVWIKLQHLNRVFDRFTIALAHKRTQDKSPSAETSSAVWSALIKAPHILGLTRRRTQRKPAI